MNYLFRIVSLTLATFLLSGCLLFNAEWENKNILFINSQNEEEVIISQSLNYGATDSDPGIRYVILNINSREIKETQIKDLDAKWIELPQKISVSPFRGHMFYEAELKTLESFGCDSFPHKNLETFNDLILNDDQYQNINSNGVGSKYYYSCQYSNNSYNSYVFRSGGGLILHTTDKDYNSISHIELMRKIDSSEFYYKKNSKLKNNRDLDLTDSIRINLSKEVGADIDNHLILTYKNSFIISNTGTIENTMSDEIGVIKIKTVSNRK